MSPVRSMTTTPGAKTIGPRKETTDTADPRRPGKQNGGCCHPYFVFRIVLLFIATALIAGCATAPERNPLPEELSNTMIYDGIPIPYARWWGDTVPTDMVQRYAELRDNSR